jgi:hypothetical protein
LLGDAAEVFGVDFDVEPESPDEVEGLESGDFDSDEVEPDEPAAEDADEVDDSPDLPPARESLR